MSIDRRRFLKRGMAGLAATGLTATGCAPLGRTQPSGLPAGDRFRHGVASGDPLSDRVILWTRVTPSTEEAGQPVRTRWAIALDKDFDQVVSRGERDARPDRDYTVKVDADGLRPATDYYYRFEIAGTPSPIGRTRTLPTGSASHVRLAFASCANYPAGYFNGYANMAERDDIDVVLHLGDYLYEYPNGEYGDGTELGRIPAPDRETVALDDYRARHATYKTDADLQAAHARHPWITIWDDHESANNSHNTGAQNHSPKTEGDWSIRKLAAIRAYSEWMPIRDLPTGLFRTFRFGNLLDLVMLDTRLHARDAVGGRKVEVANDPERTLLGHDQTSWLLATLDESKRAGSTWRVVGQQVIVSPFSSNDFDFNPDAWDGYRANRAQVLNHVDENAIENVVFLAGDVHSSWAFEVPSADDARASASAIEFVTPAISSPPIGRNPKVLELIDATAKFTPHLRYSNVIDQGYAILDLTQERARVEYIYTEPADRTRSASGTVGAVLECAAGTHDIDLVSKDESARRSDPRVSAG